MKIKNILIIFIVFILLFSICSPIVFAKKTDYADVFQFDDESFTLGGGQGTLSQIGTVIKTPTQSALSLALDIIRNIALGWAIIMIIVISIKYMVSTRSTRAQIKVDMPTYAFGILLLFGASGIMGLIQLFVNDTVGKTWTSP